MIGFWNAVLMWISPLFQMERGSVSQNPYQIILVVISRHQISGKIVLPWRKNS